MTRYEKMWILTFIDAATDHTSNEYQAGVRLAFMFIAGVGLLFSGKDEED